MIRNHYWIIYLTTWHGYIGLYIYIHIYIYRYTVCVFVCAYTRINIDTRRDSENVTHRWEKGDGQLLMQSDCLSSRGYFFFFRSPETIHTTQSIFVLFFACTQQSYSFLLLLLYIHLPSRLRGVVNSIVAKEFLPN